MRDVTTNVKRPSLQLKMLFASNVQRWKKIKDLSMVNMSEEEETATLTARNDLTASIFSHPSYLSAVI
jgi:hypothetical protein